MQKKESTVKNPTNQTTPNDKANLQTDGQIYKVIYKAYKVNEKYLKPK